MKKIAIITLPGYFNFGNRLQNYALQHALEEKGTQVITLFPARKIRTMKEFLWNFVERRNGKLCLRYFKDIEKECKLWSFTKDRILTRKIKTENGKIPNFVNEQYDCFVVGSDQVWNPNFWDQSQDSYEYFNYMLKFADSQKRIAYAASFGVSDLPEFWKKLFSDSLDQFEYISVREKAGKQLVEQLSNKAATVCIDPTMLLTAEQWRSIEQTPKRKEKYILTYMLGDLDETVGTEIEQYAREQSLKIVHITDIKGKQYAIRPEEFLGYIDNAQVVVTDSFHACVFSILFHTPFLVTSRKYKNKMNMNSRTVHLLESFGLEKQVYHAEGLSEKCDFSSVDLRLASLRKESEKFLEKIIT